MFKNLVNHTLYRLRVLFLVVVFVSLFNPCHGQEQKSGLEFTCLQWGKLPHSELFFRDGKDAVPLELNRNLRSKASFLKSKSGLFQIYIKPDPSDSPDGNVDPILVGSTALPPTTGRILFILKEAPEDSKLPISVAALEDSLETFPPGTFRFLNYSTKILPISIGDKKDGLAPKSTKVLKPNISSRGGLISLLIYDHHQNPIFAKRLFGQPRDRIMVIFTDSNDPQKVVDTMLVPQIVPVETKKTN